MDRIEIVSDNIYFSVCTFRQITNCDFALNENFAQKVQLAIKKHFALTEHFRLKVHLVLKRNFALKLMFALKGNCTLNFTVHQKCTLQ